MGLFNNNNNNDNNKLKKNKVENKSPKNKNVLGKGMCTVKDLIAPSFDRTDESCLKVDNKYVRAFNMIGFPSSVSVCWLDQLYNYEGDMDTVLYVEPTDERTALDQLTAKITQFEAQLAMEREKGNIRNVTRLGNMITALYDQRERLEQNYENLFHVSLFTNLYTDSKEELEKQTQKLDNKLKGRKINLSPLYLRQDDGYKTGLPFGKNYINDRYRNFNSGALTACFPFYNSEISHKNGVFCGVNLSTYTPVFIDFYDKKELNNSNLTVFGQSGSGKTFFVSLLTIRSALKGIRTVIIDPEREYEKLTKAVGGAHICLSADSDTHINPFDLEEEDETDEKGNPTGKKSVNIKNKVADVLNLIAVMAGGMTREQESLVSYIIDSIYKDKGFTEDVKSLYVKEPYFDEVNAIFYYDGMKKPMPTFTDFHNKLEQYAIKENDAKIKSLANSLKMFKRGGVYDMFDHQTSEDLINFQNAPIVTFDISSLEESVLRPIGMYIAMTWTWEKFVKKNPSIKKRIVCDEAWMMVNKNMAGHEYTSAFLEKAARRIRKRNGSLLVASQGFIEFANNPQGKAVSTNASINIFLSQNTTDIDAVQDTFKLSDGEKNFLLGAKKGDMLIKMNNESSIAYALAFDFEKKLIEKETQPTNP